MLLQVLFQWELLCLRQLVLCQPLAEPVKRCPVSAQCLVLISLDDPTRCSRPQVVHIIWPAVLRIVLVVSVRLSSHCLLVSHCPKCFRYQTLYSCCCMTLLQGHDVLLHHQRALHDLVQAYY